MGCSVNNFSLLVLFLACWFLLFSPASVAGKSFLEFAQISIQRSGDPSFAFSFADFEIIAPMMRDSRAISIKWKNWKPWLEPELLLPPLPL